MTRMKSLAAALAATTLLAGAAAAAEQAPASRSAATGAAASPMGKVDTDAGRLSLDGIAAFRDVHLARLAIYDAKPQQAQMFVSHAQSALDKAKGDANAFTKAEADLKPPAGMGTAATMANGDATHTAGPAGEAGHGDTAKGTTAAPSTEPVTWLPVDSQLVLADDFVAGGKDRAKAIDDANQHLKAGDRKGAMDRLKLAGVDVDFTMAVVPLATTTQEVSHAAELLRAGKYYEANAALKSVEDGVRFDVIDTTAVPKATPTAASAKQDTGKMGLNAPAAGKSDTSKSDMGKSDTSKSDTGKAATAAH